MKKRFPLFRSCGWLILLEVATRAVVAQSDRTLPPRVPPAPLPVTVEVEEGGTVSVPLRSGTRSGYRLRFLIRSGPEKGSIKGEVRQIDDSNAEVVYQHDQKNGLVADQFTYAVQGYGTAVSARAKVTVLVRGLTSQVEYPRMVTMGSIPAGLPSTEEITFSNRGKAEAVLHLEAPPPWTILGSGEIRVPADSVARVTLSVVPRGAGHLSGLLRIGGVAEGNILLSADGFPPFEVSPPSLKLGSENLSTLSVKNVSARVLALDFGEPNGVVPLASITLKADEIRHLRIDLTASAPTAADDVLSVRAAEFQATVPVAWSKSAARIVFEEEAPLDLGELRSDRPVQRRLILKNTGEEKAAVKLKSQGSWLVLPAEGTTIDLGPGQQKTIVVSGIADGAPGERRGALVATWNSGTYEMPVLAFLGGRDVSQSTTTKPAEVDAPNSVDEGKAHNPRGMDRNELARDLARNRLRILSAESFPGKVHLKWLDPSPEPRTYRIEYRRTKLAGSVDRPANVPGTKLRTEELFTSPEDVHASLESEKGSQVVSVWKGFPDSKIQQVAPQTTEAILTGLGKGALLSLRIIPIEASGRPSSVHTLLSIPLKPPPSPWWSRWQVKALAFGCLLLAAGWLVFRRRAISQISS